MLAPVLTSHSRVKKDHDWEVEELGVICAGPVHYTRTLGSHTDLQYRDDYNNRPSHSIAFIPTIGSTSGCLHSEFV